MAILKQLAIGMAQKECKKYALEQAKEHEKIFESHAFNAEVRDAQLTLRQRPDAMEAKIQAEFEALRTKLTYE